MIKEDLLQPVDKSLIPNLDNINEGILGQSFDLSNNYWVPYFCGNVGILYDKTVVDEKDLAYIMPQGEVKPMIYQLNDDQSIFFSGLARIDYTKGDKGNFICYFSRNMQIHRTKTEKADELFNRHKQLQVYGPASSMKEMKAYEFTLPEEKRDIVISGLGFICIHAPKGKIKVYVPEGIDVFMRESLI